jgi:hypothetical protein
MFILIRKYDTKNDGMFDTHDKLVEEKQFPVESEEPFLETLIDLDPHDFEISKTLGALHYAVSDTRGWIFYRVWLLETEVELILTNGCN